MRPITHQGFLDTGIYTTIISSQPAGKVATCISRNSDDYFFQNMVSKAVYTGSDPVEVRIRNGGSQYATIKVTTTLTGTNADIIFSARGRINGPVIVVNELTNCCA